MKAALTTLPDGSFDECNTVDFYDANAEELAAQYEALSFEQVHSPILEYLPASPALLLDVGAGSGRDAAALVKRGYDVVAVEPSHEFRRIGKRLHPSPRISWLDDELPNLNRIVETDSTFDAILCSAVWMHLTGDQQRRAMRCLSQLLVPSGRLFISFRSCASDERPGVYETGVGDVIRQATESGLLLLHQASSPDVFHRPGIVWFSLSIEAEH